MKESLKYKVIDILKNPRVIVLLLFLLSSYVMMFGLHIPDSDETAVINGISINSAAEEAGIKFDDKATVLNFEQIVSVNDKSINSVDDYFNAIEKLEYNKSFILKTNKGQYDIFIPSQSNESNKSINEIVGLSVQQKSNSNIKLGIELAGGSRLILVPKINLTDDDFNMLVSSLQNRLDLYGASGTKVNKISDAFTGEKFISVESISANKNEIFDLIRKQGEFEAKVGNISVFTGENVLQVFNDPQHAGLQECSQNNNGEYLCTYRFSIEIDSGAGDKFFEETSKLNVVAGGHLSEKIYFFLDGEEITGLNVASSFKYQKVTNPQITVTGDPQPTRELAMESGKKEMRLLQTLLSTQSLPSELEIVESYSISSSLGQKLLDNALLVGMIAVLLVASVVALRYRHFGIFVGIVIALVGEVIIVLGLSGLLNKVITIDLAAIGGLIAAIGTGVDDQIIITDEYFRKRKKELKSRQKIKNAFYIIMIAYFTTLAAMIPLMFAGLKMLQGFSLMILLGVTVGVLITRPAYAAMLRIIMTTREQRAEEARDED